MKKLKRFFALMLALAIAISVNVPSVSQAGSSKYWWTSTKTTEYDYRDGKWVKNYELKSSYDSKGRYKGYTSCFYSYDEETKKVTKGGTSKAVYKYDSNGNTSKYSYYYNGKLDVYVKYYYDSKYRTTKQKEYNSKKKLQSTTTFKYDSHDNIIKETTKYTDKNKKTTTTKHKYTYKNNVAVKCVTTYSNGGKHTYEFTKKGILKKSYSKYDWGSDETTYDKYGRESKSIYENSYSKEVTTYKYKNKKDWNASEIKRVKTIKETGEVTTEIIKVKYKTKKDKHGNVTERIRYENDVPISKSVYSGWKKFKNTSN